ncbi:MAG: sulfatase [Bacteroidales bacterium]|nr:sulfatase [Bacteroidales bacterium]
MKINNLRSFVLLGCVASSFTASAQQKPNMVLFIADDVSWDDLGCYGNKNVKTPNIDKLAARGIRFNNFFLTASSSSPSRNSIITGRYPHNTGAAELHSEPPLDMVSFPELLKKQGYFTGHAGKFHMGNYALRGFDVSHQKNNGDGGEDMWLHTIQNRPKDKPFMMWFAALDAHRDWGPNEFSGTHNPESLNPPAYLVNDKETRIDLGKYYDEIARFDHHIGLIVSELTKQNVLENTVIIVMADNGRAFPHSKTRVNDRGMKSPFIVCWPKGIGTKPKVSNSLVSAIDIAPTLLELAKADIPEMIQGVSFAKLLKNPEKPFRNYVFAEHNWHDYEAHERMVRTRDFLYILNSRPEFTNLGPADAVGGPSFAGLKLAKEIGTITPVQAEIFLSPRPAEELYHNPSDPDQFKNLASDPAYSTNLSDLRKKLKEWMDITGDDIPQNLTRDWYLKEPGYIKTDAHGKYGENAPEPRNNAVKK